MASEVLVPPTARGLSLPLPPVQGKMRANLTTSLPTKSRKSYGQADWTTALTVVCESPEDSPRKPTTKEQQTNKALLDTSYSSAANLRPRTPAGGHRRPLTAEHDANLLAPTVPSPRSKSPSKSPRLKPISPRPKENTATKPLVESTTPMQDAPEASGSSSLLPSSSTSFAQEEIKQLQSVHSLQSELEQYIQENEDILRKKICLENEVAHMMLQSRGSRRKTYPQGIILIQMRSHERLKFVGLCYDMDSAELVAQIQASNVQREILQRLSKELEGRKTEITKLQTQVIQQRAAFQEEQQNSEARVRHLQAQLERSQNHCRLMESKADSMRYQVDESAKKHQELEEHFSTSVELLKSMLQQQHMQMQPPKSPLRLADMQPDRMHCEDDGNTLSVNVPALRSSAEYRTSQARKSSLDGRMATNWVKLLNLKTSPNVKTMPHHIIKNVDEIEQLLLLRQ